MNLIPRKFYLDDVFDDFLINKKDQNMRCDIYEKDDVYHIEMDVAGFAKEEISVEVKNGYLTIKAEKNSETNEEDSNKNYLRRERVYGTYERSFDLGDLDQDKINAQFNNGVLAITVPKKEEIDDKKVIEIH